MNKQLPGQTVMQFGPSCEPKKPFVLTPLEKSLIRAYVRYRRATGYNVSICDVLVMFNWDDPQHERYVPAYQDWACDNLDYEGEFNRARKAIADYAQECADKLDKKI